MAKITFKAGKNFESALTAMEGGYEDVARAAIYKGAKIVADKMAINLASVLKHPTGALQGSLGITPISRDKRGVLNARVGFEGVDTKKVSNPLKARVIEKRTPFSKPTLSQTRSAVEEIMAKVATSSIDEIVKGS